MSSFSGPTVVINDGNMASDITSSPSMLLERAGCSFQIVWSGTSPVGTVAIEGSNDANINSGIDAGTWEPLPILYSGASVNSIPLSGNSGKGMIDMLITAIYAVRVKYTATSGTGTMTVTMMSKVV